MLLSIDNLEVCYGVISALQGVSLQIDQGEVVTLIGSNGAGKTTLLRTISGLLRPRRGTISWSGSQTLNELRPDQIVQLGLAPLIVRKIFQIIKDINAQGTTIFLVEQNAHMALSVAHRGYVLQSGRMILSDKASNLLEHPDVKKAYLGG